MPMRRRVRKFAKLQLYLQFVPEWIGRSSLQLTTDVVWRGLFDVSLNEGDVFDSPTSVLEEGVSFVKSEY